MSKALTRSKPQVMESLDRLLRLTQDEVRARFDAFKRLTHFEAL